MKGSMSYFMVLVGLTHYAFADNNFTNPDVVSIIPSNRQAYVDSRQNSVAGNEGINWIGLCGYDQSLLDKEGCSPDCNGSSMATYCNQLIRNSQIEKFSYIPLPYDSHGVFIFRLNDSFASSTAIFTTQVGTVPEKGSGYFCETVYGDGTPAPLINITTTSHSSTQTIDYHCVPTAGVSGCHANGHVNFMSQANGNPPHFAWFKNTNQPLYLVCLSFVEVDSNPAVLQSSTGCTGMAGSCVSYTLQ